MPAFVVAMLVPFLCVFDVNSEFTGVYSHRRRNTDKKILLGGQIRNLFPRPPGQLPIIADITCGLRETPCILGAV